jgi:hypothetical protein
MNELLLAAQNELPHYRQHNCAYIAEFYHINDPLTSMHEVAVHAKP